MRKAVFIESLAPAALDEVRRALALEVSAGYGERFETARRVFEEDMGSTAPLLRDQGWVSSEIFVNCEAVQRAWANESRVVPHGLSVAIEQVRTLSPDVLFVGDIHSVPSVFLRAVRPHVALVVGRLATQPDRVFPSSDYDVVLSPYAGTRLVLEACGTGCEPEPFASPSEVKAEGVERSFLERARSIVWCGDGPDSGPRAPSVLDAISAMAPALGYDVGTSGSASGRQRRLALATARMAVVAHSEHHGVSVGQPSLVQATLAGALVFVDYRSDLAEHFAIGAEVVAYRTPAECAALIAHYAAHPERAVDIARAGRARALRDYGSARYGAQLSDILVRALADRSTRPSSSSRVSSSLSQARRAFGGAGGL